MKTNHLYFLSLECRFSDYRNPVDVWTIRRDNDGVSVRTKCYIRPTPASIARVQRAQVEIIKRQTVSIDQI